MKLSLKRPDLERLLIAGAAVLVLLLAAKGAKPPSPVDSYVVPYDQVLPDAPTLAQNTGPTLSTTVYYSDADGYLIPVTRQIPQTDGIAKATLSLMLQTGANDMEAARLGLRTLIPEGTTFDLDIAGGKARIDLGDTVLSMADAEQEAAMVSAVVQTLTEFDSVDSVEFLVAGQKRSKLTHGTDIAGVMTGNLLNLESVETGASVVDAQLVRLYFPSETGRVMVPVTRAVFGNADINTAVLELVKGPKKDSGLQSSLPSDVGLIDVSVSDGVATVNFSQEFAQIVSASDGGQRALRAIMLTCMHYPGVKQVKLQVDGKPFTLQPSNTPTFVNSAEEVASQFPGVIEVD